MGSTLVLRRMEKLLHSFPAYCLPWSEAHACAHRRRNPINRLQPSWRSPNSRCKCLSKACFSKLLGSCRAPRRSRSTGRRHTASVGKCRWSQSVFICLRVLCPAPSTRTPSPILLGSYEILLDFPFVNVLSFHIA